jgi:Domain of unknown function (DUF5916)/Carbohydrate family 9 binding domain-like
LFERQTVNMMTRRAALLLCCLALTPAVYAADPPIRIARITEPIRIDGDLSDPAWQKATRFDTWYETNPGDNVPPRVTQTGWVAYDDKFFYVALKLDDPHPEQIRAPYGDHDNISGNSDDFAGIAIDSRNDSKTAIEFFVTPHNIQYDASQDDNSGEDSSPDWFWDSAAKITPEGWQLEMRIPFSSLRYTPADVQTWGVILYRNYPRDRRYQIFSHKLPRDSSCFVCNYNKVTGLERLPSDQHFVAAPYVTANEATHAPAFDGAPLRYRRPSGDQGLDVKWTPNADNAIDATINPDFSQIESDVAAISTNERFAIFYPEKRPFFLEDVSLFATPIQAVSTRSITSPRWGGRGTGKFDSNAYTLLVAQDRGGGATIVPGPVESHFASQDFASTAVIGRLRRDLGTNSFVSFLATTREISGGAHNRVFGPDFLWRPNDRYTITGQFLLSDSRTPDRPDLDAEWDGRHLRSHAADLRVQRATAKDDLLVEYLNLGDQFRADNGFVPQVGYRSLYTEVGHTIRPSGFFSRVRFFTFGQYETEQDGSQLYRLVSAGFGADGRHRSFWRIRLANENVRTRTGAMFQRNQLVYTIQFGVNRVLSYLSFDGWVGQDVDFDNDRLGKGATINFNGTLHPTDHLELKLTDGLRFLNVDPGHLFTAQVERVRATYMFDSRRFVRLVVQNERGTFNPALYDPRLNPILPPPRSGDLATQLLFAYKLNWQTVLYVGAGDLRDVDTTNGEFFPSARSVFVKVSYAFQR